jgi:hypothetical protein
MNVKHNENVLGDCRGVGDPICTLDVLDLQIEELLQLILCTISG